MRKLLHALTCEDATGRPDVYGGSVDLGPHEDLGGTVPQRHYLATNEEEELAHFKCNQYCVQSVLCVAMATSAENILTGMPKALARPKSASLSSPF